MGSIMYRSMGPMDSSGLIPGAGKNCPMIFKVSLSGRCKYNSTGRLQLGIINPDTQRPYTVRIRDNAYKTHEQQIVKVPERRDHRLLYWIPWRTGDRATPPPPPPICRRGRSPLKPIRGACDIE